ncbi:hypothetical protein [Thiocapsa sp.]
MLTLPEGLEQHLWSEVQQFDEEKHMLSTDDREVVEMNGWPGE